MTRKFLLLTFFVLLVTNAIAQNYITQSFDGTTYPPTGWSINTPYGGSDYGGPIDWTRVTSYGGIEPQEPTHTGAGMSWYNSWDIYYGESTLMTPGMNFAAYSTGSNQVSFWMFRSADVYWGGYEYDWVDIYVNTSASLSGATFLDEIYDGIYNYPTVSSEGWYQYTYTLPASFSSSSSVYILFDANTGYAVDMYLDDVSVDHIPPCTGTPSISIGRMTGACSGRSFTLTASTPTVAAGLFYQWQSASSPTGPWSSISGATNTTYTTSITSTTYFRCQLQCSYSGLTGTSNVDTISINPTALCPCVPSSYYSYYGWDAGCQYRITNFTCVAVNTLNEAGQSCSGVAGDPGYYDRTGVPSDTILMYQGGNYSGSITDNYGYEGAKRIWIDFNDDGTFAATEAMTPIMMSGGYYPITTHTYQLFIPLSAPLGPHRMRVRYVMTYTYTGPDVNHSLYNAYLDPCAYYYCASSCDYYYYGTTYDYEIKIIQAPACSGTPAVTIVPAGPQRLCPGVVDTLYATSSPAQGYTYQWQLSTNGGTVWSNIAGATSTMYAFTVSTSTIGWYRLNVTCTSSSTTAASNTVIVNLAPPMDCPCSTPTSLQYYYNYMYGYAPCYSYHINRVQVVGNTTMNDVYSTCLGWGYEDRTGVAAIADLLQGGSATWTCGFQYTSSQLKCTIWIDYNDDGIFGSAEVIDYFNVTSTTMTRPAVTIPTTAPTGRHRMRVRYCYTSTTAVVPLDPCSYSNPGGSLNYYGDAHDYYVNIISNTPTPTLSPSTTQNLCVGQTISITATTTATGSPFTYSWTGPNGFTSTTTTSSTTNTITISPAAFINSGPYYCRVTPSGGLTSAPAIDTIFIWPYPVFTAGTVTSNSPVCTPAAIQLNGSAVPSSSTYSWTGPSSYTSTLGSPSLSPSTTAMSGTYSVTASNHGCNTSGNVSVTVYQTPAISSISSIDPTTCTCNCGSITLNGLLATTTYTVNYLRNGSAVGPLSITTNASGQLVITGLNSAIYSNITVTKNGCPSAPAGPITLNNPSVPPSPTVSTNAPVCLSTPLTFSGTVSATGLSWTWSGPGGWTYTSSGLTSSTTKTASAAFTDSGNYLVYVTDALGCTSPVQTINVVIKPRPNTPTVVSNNAALPGGLCTGQTLNLSMTTSTPPGTPAGISYTWTDPTGGTTNPSTSTTYSTTGSVSVANVPANFAGNWAIYSVLNGCASAAPASVYTYIKWIPGKPTVTSNSPVCSGAGYNPNVILLTSGDSTLGVTYTWSGPNAYSVTGSSSSTQTITSPSISASGTYTVYATLLGCNSPSSSTTVVVNQTPGKPTVSPSYTAYCQNDLTVPLTATGTNLLWHTASTGGVGSTSAPTPSTTIAGLFLWYVTQTTNYTGVNCEGPAAIDSVLVKGKPSVPYTTKSFTYCQGDNAAPFTAIGANLLWYTSKTGGVGSPVPITPSTAVAGNSKYYVTQTVNGCESDRFEISVQVNAKPAKPGVTVKHYCQNDFALPLSASGTNLLWYTSSTGGVGSSIAPTPNTAYADTLYYYVTQTVNYGPGASCQSDRAQLMVIVDYTPNALIVANEPYVCQYDSIFFTYYGNALPNAIYNWTMPVGATMLHGNSGQGPIWIKFDSAGKRIVSLQVTNKSCKSPLTNYIVDVRTAPLVPTNVKNEVCQGQILDVSLGYANEQIDKYDWNFDGADIVYGSEGGPFGIRYNTPGVHIINMVAWTNSCPSIPINDTVTVHPLADAHIGQVSNSAICAGDSVMFTAERYNPAYLYQWEPAIYFGTQTNQGQVYGFVEHSGYINLHVTTEFGCTSTDSTLITAQPCCEVFFPNAFTPNGDGKNDVFRPVSRGNQVIKTFRVANRWGQVMFETVNPRIGWDGKFNGTLQDLGTYYYYIKYVCANGKVYEEKGEFLLIK